MTTELLVVRALERGLTLRDFEILTPGMIFGYIITWNNANLDKEEIESAAKGGKVHIATQADFDRF